MAEQVSYYVHSDRSITFKDIPVGEEGKTIEVTMRPLTRRDRDFVTSIESTEYAEEKLLALLITKWGDAPGVTSLELQDTQYDEAVVILGQAFAQFFRKQYTFVPVPRSGVVPDRIPP